MENKQTLIRPGYCIAILLIVFPLIDALASLWPLDLGSEQWRFAAIGTLSSAALTQVLGLFLALALAVVFEHGRIRRIVGWINLGLALLVVVICLVFTLDYLQTRAGVALQWRSAMDLASIVVIVKQIALVLALAWLGIAGVRGPKPVKRLKRHPSQEPPSLIS